MKLINRVFVTLALLLAFSAVLLQVGMAVPGAAQESTPEPRPEWGYEGDLGAENWGSLGAVYAACGEGRAQSPIDISSAQSVDLKPIQFSYEAVPLAIFNNGHTIEVEYEAGSHIIYNERQYDLIQFHFHHPSEHTIAGESFPMELHLVHRSADGDLAVVGVLLRAREADNAAFAPIFENLPAEEGEPAESTISINAADLLPASRLYYTYGGSLTTPPCTEGVRWLLLTTPVELSQAQVDAFSAIFSLNARPVQPLNERDLLQDSGE